LLRDLNLDPMTFIYRYELTWPVFCGGPTGCANMNFLPSYVKAFQSSRLTDRLLLTPLFI